MSPDPELGGGAAAVAAGGGLESAGAAAEESAGPLDVESSAFGLVEAGSISSFGVGVPPPHAAAVSETVASMASTAAVRRDIVGMSASYHARARAWMNE